MSLLQCALYIIFSPVITVLGLSWRSVFCQYVKCCFSRSHNCIQSWQSGKSLSI